MNKKNMPEIRFSGFDDEWKQNLVKDIFHITRGYVLSTKKISDVKRGKYIYPVFSSQTMDNGLLGYYKDYLYDNSITWTTDGANAGSVNFRSGKFYCTNVCGVLLSETGNANSMVANAINNVAHNFVSRVGNPKLMNNIMAEIPFRKPSLLSEELKISEFLNKIDDLINKTEKQYNYFKNIKESLLNKMFPENYSNEPEIRFKGFNNKWKNSILKNIINIERGASPRPIDKFITRSLGGYNWIKISDAPSDGIYIDKTSEKIIKEGLSKTKVVNKGDLILSNSMSYGRPHIVNLFGCIHDGWLLIKDYEKYLNNLFFCYFLGSENMLKKYKSLAAGSTVNNLNKELVLNCNIDHPELNEQEKIGKLFKNLDDLITLIKQKHEKLKNIKNALLDKMFC